jgi:hypothetical protein
MKARVNNTMTTMDYRIISCFLLGAIGLSSSVAHAGKEHFSSEKSEALVELSDVQNFRSIVPAATKRALLTTDDRRH